MAIRQNIKPTNNSEFLSQEKFFNSVAFWQRAYEASEAEQAKLLNKIHDLEQRNQGLLVKLRIEPTISDGRSALGKKPSTLINKKSQESAKSRSKPRRPAVSSQGAAVGETEVKDNQEETANGKPNTTFGAQPTNANRMTATKLMRQLFVLQRALQKKQKPSYLANEAVILCKEAEAELLLAIQRQETAKSPQTAFRPDKDAEPNLITVIKSLEMSFCLAHGALHKIQNDESCETYKSQVIYYLVCLFESTMTALAQHCVGLSTCSDQEAPDPKPTSATAKIRAHGKKRSSQPSSSVKSMETEGLTNLLCTMALSLDPERCDDGKVMEGILYVALNRMGKLLALFTFQDLRLPTTCQEMTLPDGLKAMEREALSLKSVELEARHLITFWERMLSHSFISTPANEAARSHLFQKSKDRLQRTLLGAVFGDGEPSFQDGLRSPATPPPQDCISAPSDRTQFSDWFTQELWRLVGWDLLGSMASGG